MRKSLKGRFRIWDLGTDQYSHLDLAHNWDKVDEIVGGPDGGPGVSSATTYPTNVESTWVGSTSTPYAYFAQERYPGGGYGDEQQIVGKSLYNVVAGLNFNDVPLGTVVAWWTPFGVSASNGTIPGGIGQFLPNGWAICDGSTISASNHSFPTSGKSITLPDLRNKTVVGATNTKQGINAVGDYRIVQSASALPFDGYDSAPGVGYDSGVETAQVSGNPSGIKKTGSNVIRDVAHRHGLGSLKIPEHSHEIKDHIHNVKPHQHMVYGHSHGMLHQHHLPNHIHAQILGDFRMTAHADGYDRRVAAGTDYYVSQRDHVHGVSVADGYTGGRRPPSDGTGLIFPEIYPYSTDWGSQASYSSWPVALISGGARSDQGPIPVPVQARERKATTDNNLDALSGAAQAVTDTAFAPPSPTGVNSTSPVRTGSVFAASEKPAVLGSMDSWPPANADEVRKSQINPRTDYVGLLYIMKIKVSTNII